MGTDFTISRKARAEHIDELGHVNNAVYVGWIQDVATAHWRAVAPPDIVDRFVWVVVRHEIDYRAATHVGETVTLATRVGIPKGARFDRFVDILGPDEKLRVSARTVWAMLDRDTMRPQRIGPSVVEPFTSESD
ncbi:MAG: acyl-CoA thioesterase [Pacificimonas sp.]